MLLFSHSKGVSLIGGSDPQTDIIKRSLKMAPNLYCADGGAVFAPIQPKAVIGDFDSYDEKSVEFQNINKVLINDQNTTDFDKCIQSIDAGFYLCLGFTGGRMDHHFASFSTLTRNTSKKLFLIGESDFAFVASQRICLKLGTGCPFSIYPVIPCTVSTHGLKWDLDKADMRPDGLISTSNETQSDDIILDVHSGSAIVILSNDLLETVVDQLT